MYILFKLFNRIELIIEILLMIRFILSWISPMMRNSFTDTVYSLTEPLLRPFRSILTFGGIGIDLSPIILIMVIRILKSILFKLIILLL